MGTQNVPKCFGIVQINRRLLAGRAESRNGRSARRAEPTVSVPRLPRVVNLFIDCTPPPPAPRPAGADAVKLVNTVRNRTVATLLINRYQVSSGRINSLSPIPIRSHKCQVSCAIIPMRDWNHWTLGFGHATNCKELSFWDNVIT